jgi:hypothetical protein
MLQDLRRSLMKLLLVIIIATTLGTAQDRSIWINDVEVTVGMPKSSTLSRLETRSDMKRDEALAGDSWCIQPKGENDLAPWHCDTVIFENDKVVGIVHDLGGASGDQAAAMLSKLYSALVEAGRSKSRVSVVPQREHERDGWRYRSITFSIGAKQFNLDVSEPVGSGVNRRSSVNLSESMYDYPNGYSTVPKGHPPK